MVEENKIEKVEQKKEESMEKKDMKVEEKKEQIKKENKVEKVKKYLVSVYGPNLSISPKVGVHICNMIRGKNIDKALKMLEEVLGFRRAVKMNNMEIGHRHGKRMMAGRYPQNASGEFARLLKQLKANAIYHELELEKSRITQAYTNVASKPYKRGGARFKRANVFLELSMKKEEKKQNKNEQGRMKK